MTGRVTPARLASLDALRRVREGVLADRALEAAAAALPVRDRAWVQELVYGTLRLRGRIDHLLDALARQGTAAIDPDVLDVLRLGAYQLREMGSVPAYAAISQSQELIRAAGSARAAGFVSGVLHTLERKGDQLRFPDPLADPAGYLSTYGSHPRWLVERWLHRWGVDGARALVAANNARPELYLRPLGIGREEAAARLLEIGADAEPVDFSATSLRVLSSATVAEILAVIPAVVQDPAATMVVEYAAVPQGARVLDLCAAPGGKALGLAERAGFVAAADLSPRRLRRVRENASRLAWDKRVGVVAADGRHPPFRSADLVLLDVPCTGTGTLRRHPDGRWRLREDHLSALTVLQRSLLDSAAAVVRPGGWLVYSTCSLEQEENEVQVKAFLERHPEWAVDPPGTVPAELLDERGCLYVLPHRENVDGSFAARLRRPA